MVDESQKMTALKKAYAEIILNTAKEAAVRVLASERKAQQYYHQLTTTKDEALHLLLRLKQTMDSKIIEVEAKSQNQHRKIEELEAQLQEAEEIVSSLRAELNEAHTKLDVMADKALLASQSQAHRIDSFFNEPELPSIISRRKEPQLHRNGCTQRIRACEGNLLKSRFSLTRGLESLDHPENVKELKKDEEGGKNITCVEDEVVIEDSLDASGSSSESAMKNSISLDLDVKVQMTSDELSSPPSKDSKVLKYTFQRKRKKEHEDNPSTEKRAKNQIGCLEPVLGDMTESLPDDHRMAQSAHQLISLSDK